MKHLPIEQRMMQAIIAIEAKDAATLGDIARWMGVAKSPRLRGILDKLVEMGAVRKTYDWGWGRQGRWLYYLNEQEADRLYGALLQQGYSPFDGED